MSEEARADVEEKQAVVAIFDVLGTKSETAADPGGFIEKLTGLVEDTEAHLQYLPHAVAGELEPADVPDPEVIAFADNLIVTWEILPEIGGGHHLDALGNDVARIFLNGLDRDLLLRGAVSLGTYVRKGYHLVGPAVSDAATWAEAANWAGVIGTPKTVPHLRHRMYARHERTLSDLGLLPSAYWWYDVPLAGDETLSTWAVAWPDVLWSVVLQDHDQDLNRLLSVATAKFRGFEIPKGAVTKFENTRSFLDDFVENVAPASAELYKEWGLF